MHCCEWHAPQLHCEICITIPNTIVAPFFVSAVNDRRRRQNCCLRVSKTSRIAFAVVYFSVSINENSLCCGHWRTRRTRKNSSLTHIYVMQVKIKMRTRKNKNGFVNSRHLAHRRMPDTCLASKLTRLNMNSVVSFDLFNFF